VHPVDPLPGSGELAATDGHPGGLELEDGRGLFLMKRLMDNVERFQDKGNVVRLTIKR